ncbi:FadR/GntR family transcriptional regulator [Bacillus salitolerans]|uniref:FadR/GntR family transcriptional regulator n=1 Tax=Bacillus salitolerans TaxID=1437434 RepID=A0ABW4LSN9_9BACI
MSIPQSKVYIETIKEIHKIIAEDSLQPGDKIPSERELSDRLKVGRSSLREALRALELLGLIETRRGEGTFVKDFGGHHLVELIGNFILQNEKAKSDLIETKSILEEQAILLACTRIEERFLEQLNALIKQRDQSFQHEFMKTIVLSTGNRLLLKIWALLAQYTAPIIEEQEVRDFSLYEQLIAQIDEGKADGAIQMYRKLES